MRILTINGSGTGGYRAAKFLNYLENSLDKPLHETFDMIAGISSGSIVGAYIANGNRAEHAAEKMRELIPEVFKSPRGFFMNLFYSRYKSDSLKNILKENFDFSISEINTKFMTYAMHIDGEFITNRHWKSWKDSIKTYDALLASSAAPSFFDPYQFEDEEEGIKKKKTFIDGGVVANNPSMCALSEAIKQGNKLEDIFILNIGSGVLRGSTASKYRGLLSLAQELPFSMMAASERIDEYQTLHIMNKRILNILPITMTAVDSCDFNTFDFQSNIMWVNNKKFILDFFKNSY